MSRQIKFRAWNSIDKLMCASGVVVPRLNTLLANKHYHVMQFTGLLDIRGKEIYEGDIIEWAYNWWVIEWEDSDASFFAVEISMGIMHESGQEWGGNCEVIGNIYQNPELLEEN